jgi:hypothetical protein
MKILKEIARNPQIDWIIILLISLVLTLGLVFTGFSLYNAVAEGTIVSKQTTKSTSFTKLNEKVISTVLDTYALREEASTKARAGYTGTPDPSI